ncbi:MAG: hypothetical protein DI536_01260 [Archangium gephyra]|uniref:Uncharacterized protein n=1 Tax=Archangium gephyra TaxID=48 RepID=A0A2W5U230_9BACT|nr:MAG: hypothetical protein DI536_01260 [Archangium gephyra]
MIPERIPFETSRCHACVHKRDVKTPRSHFLMCQQGTPPKYPPQPVLECGYFTQRVDESSP